MDLRAYRRLVLSRAKQQPTRAAAPPPVAPSERARLSSGMLGKGSTPEGVAWFFGDQP